MKTVVPISPWRQRRLARGWQPHQLVIRMKIAASRDGMMLPRTYLLVRLMFLWENHRVPVPGYYADLLYRAFTTPIGATTSIGEPSQGGPCDR